MVVKGTGRTTLNLMKKVNYNELHSIESNNTCRHKENLPHKT